MEDKTTHVHQFITHKRKFLKKFKCTPTSVDHHLSLPIRHDTGTAPWLIMAFGTNIWSRNMFPTPTAGVN